MQIAPEVDFHEEEALGRAYDARLMRRLLRYLRPYRFKVALAVLMLIAASGLELIGPYLTAVAIDKAIPERDLDLLTILAGIYTLALVFALLLSYAQTLLTTWIGQSVMYDLRTQIFAQLQRMSLRFFDRNPVGRLMTRLTSDVEVLNEMFTSGVVAIFGDVFTLAFIVAIMLTMSWKLALVSFTVLPLVWAAAYWFRKNVRRTYREVRVKLARINAFLQERILDPLGMKDTLTLFDRNDPRARRVAPLFAGSKGAWMRAWRPYHPMYPFTYGSQSLYATPMDFARFMALWMDRFTWCRSREAVRGGASRPPSAAPSPLRRACAADVSTSAARTATCTLSAPKARPHFRRKTSSSGRSAAHDEGNSRGPGTTGIRVSAISRTLRCSSLVANQLSPTSRGSWAAIQRRSTASSA